MEIIVLDGHTLNPGDLSWDPVSKFGRLTVYERTPPEKIIERVGGSEIVLTNKTPLSRGVFEKCKNIKFVSVLATGYNVVDVGAAKEFGVVVSNVPSYGTAAVAQFTFALLLEVCHNARRHADSVAEGRWARSEDFCYWDYPLIELAGKTFGIVGYGSIGKAVAKIAAAFGMNVITSDPEYKMQSDNVKPAGLDELLSSSDVISLHCPLNSATDKIINADSISKMKDGVILINTSRGRLADENAVRDALDSGKIYFYAADVVSEEPIRPDNPLLAAKNILITPHIAWAPRESRGRLMETTSRNIEAFLRGEPVNRVN